MPELVQDAPQVAEGSSGENVDSLKQESVDQINKEVVQDKPVFDKSVFEPETKDAKQEEVLASNGSTELAEQPVEELAGLSDEELAGMTTTDGAQSEETESSAKPDLVAELPEDIWDISKNKSSNDGGLRFAEDIDELRRGSGSSNQKRTKRKVRNTRRTK